MATWGYYGTLAEHNDYWASHGSPQTWADANDDAKTSAIHTASDYLDIRYGRRWKGYRATRDQVLDWPRAGVCDRDGYAVSSDSVPQTIKDAVSILALKVLEGTDLLPDVAAGEVSSFAITGKSEQVGPIRESTTYSEGSASVSHLPRITKVEGLLSSSGLLTAPGRAQRG